MVALAFLGGFHPGDSNLTPAKMQERLRRMAKQQVTFASYGDAAVTEIILRIVADPKMQNRTVEECFRLHQSHAERIADDIAGCLDRDELERI